MADIDLIPASWRAEQRARRTLRGGLVAVGCAIAAVAAVRIGLEIANRQATTALQVAIALAAIALLTKKKWLEYGMYGVAAVGLGVGALAFLHI